MKTGLSLRQLWMGCVVVALSAACVTAAPKTRTPGPTDTLVPPTSARIPPTSTPIPPTATPVPPLAVLENFLGHLAAGHHDAAYDLVAPSSKEQGEPTPPVRHGIPFPGQVQTRPVDYALFLKTLESPTLVTWSEGDYQPVGDIRDKFKDYEIGKGRWVGQRRTRFRVFVTFQKWDRDEVCLVLEGGQWYVADPIHIIR